MKQQILGLALFSLGVLFSVSFNNCMGGAEDTRVIPRLGENFLATNPLVWRPNRLASFTCSVYQKEDSVFNSFKFPTYMVWQTNNNPGPNTSKDKLPDDPFQPGMGLSAAAKSFILENDLTDLSEIKYYLPANVTPFLYYQSRGPSGTGTGMVTDGKSDWAIDGSRNGPYYVYSDTKNTLKGKVLDDVARRKNLNINPMRIFNLPRSETHINGEAYLGLGWKDPAGKSLRSLYTFLLPESESNPDGEVYVGGEALRVRVNGHAVEGAYGNSNESDVIIGMDTFGDEQEQRGLTSSSKYFHYWSCTYYFVTDDTSKCQKTGDPEPDSPIATGNMSVKGYFGKYKGYNCFAVTDFGGSKRCYDDSMTITRNNVTYKYDPIKIVEVDPNAPGSQWVKNPDAWRIPQSDKDTTVAWLSYCKRITEKK